MKPPKSKSKGSMLQFDNLNNSTPVASETVGPWGFHASAFVSKLVQRYTGDSGSVAFVCQLVSFALPRGNDCMCYLAIATGWLGF